VLKKIPKSKGVGAEGSRELISQAVEDTVGDRDTEADGWGHSEMLVTSNS
jgi:hypothetical protein